MSHSVLFVHNRYLERGGEDSVFEAESALLAARGHRVERLVFDNSELPSRPGALDKLRMAAETVWSVPAQRRLRRSIESFRPEVVHFHNTLPQVSPAAYRTARQAGAAVVQTLHNFRLVCPSGLLYRDGLPCESCVGGLPLASLTHVCYRGSRQQTAAVAAMLVTHRALGTWRRDVDLYLSPSRFLASKVVQGGVPAERIMVKPNFLSPDPGPGGHSGDYVLFVGRLTETKGLRTLLDAYRTGSEGLPPLRIAGAGELSGEVEAAAAADPRIRYLGQLSREQVLTQLSEARALVFPSVWYENFPVTVVEAFATGTPVIASRLGALPEIVEDGRSGLLFEPGSAAGLAARLRDLQPPGGAARMGAAARARYLASYGPETAYELLLAAYDRAVSSRAAAA